eukprot:gene11346-13893_t
MYTLKITGQQQLYKPANEGIREGEPVEVYGAVPFSNVLYSSDQCSIKITVYFKALNTDYVYINYLLPNGTQSSAEQSKRGVPYVNIQYQTPIDTSYSLSFTVFRALNSSKISVGSVRYDNYATISCIPFPDIDSLQITQSSSNQKLYSTSFYEFTGIFEMRGILYPLPSNHPFSCDTESSYLDCQIQQLLNPHQFQFTLFVQPTDDDTELYPTGDIVANITKNGITSNNVQVRFSSIFPPELNGNPSTNIKTSNIYPENDIVEGQILDATFRPRSFITVSNPSSILYYQHRHLFSSSLRSVPTTRSSKYYKIAGTKDNLVLYSSGSLSLSNNYTSCLTFNDGTQRLCLNPKNISFSNSIDVLPSLPGSGRVRTNDNQYVTFEIVDNEPPVLRYLKLFKLTPQSDYLTFRMKVTDNLSGVSYFSFNSDFTEVYESYRFLIYGNMTDGTYEITVPYTSITTIRIHDGANRISTYSTNQPQILDGDYPGYNYFYYPGFEPFSELFTISNITSFSIAPHNLIDVSDNETEILFLVGVKNPMLDFRPRIRIYFTQDKTVYKEFSGDWNKRREVYQISIMLPRNLVDGRLEYEFLNMKNSFSNFEFKSSVLVSVFGASADLRVTSKEGDVMEPMITKITSFSIPETNIIGWNLTIEDTRNGFLWGQLNVTSEYDLTPYSFNLTSANRISGDDLKGDYSFSIQVDSRLCRNQIFKISQIKLYDRGINLGNGDDIFGYQPFSLTKIIGTPQESQLSIQYNCNPVGGLNTTIPVITNVTLSKSIMNVGSSSVAERTTYLRFEIYHPSGISKRHLPLVYAQSYSIRDLLEFPSVRISDSLNATVAYFESKIVIPHGYGERYILLSIYGIVSNHLSLNGYNSYSLTDVLPNNNVMLTTTNSYDPFLESHSTLFYPVGGRITVFGKNFVCQGLLLQTDLAKPLTFTQMAIDDCSVPMIIFHNPNNLTSYNFKVRIQSNYSSSNELVINAKDPPVTHTNPEPTIPCEGEPPCSGHGQCIENTCKCDTDWMGADCNSKIVDGVEPGQNESEPSTNLTIDQYNSLISIIAIRELGHDRQEEIRYFNLIVSNTHLEGDSLKTEDAKESKSRIGVNVPNFRFFAVIDPNFQFLVDYKKESPERTCKKSGLTLAQLIGIIVGSIVAAALII